MLELWGDNTLALSRVSEHKANPHQTHVLVLASAVHNTSKANMTAFLAQRAVEDRQHDDSPQRQLFHLIAAILSGEMAEKLHSALILLLSQF